MAGAGADVAVHELGTGDEHGGAAHQLQLLGRVALLVQLRVAAVPDLANELGWQGRQVLPGASPPASPSTARVWGQVRQSLHPLPNHLGGRTVDCHQFFTYFVGWVSIEILLSVHKCQSFRVDTKSYSEYCKPDFYKNPFLFR